MQITANTKIATLLKHNSDALEAIVSLSSKFEKLRNPLLRKIMAGRSSIAMAAKIGGCTVEDFFQKLEPLGFSADRSVSSLIERKKALPAFLRDLKPEKIVELDVRPVFEQGNDPLSIILDKIATLKEGEVLKLINTFEPTPLMHLLKKKGFESYADTVDDETVEVYFSKTGIAAAHILEAPKAEGWDQLYACFAGQMDEIDVRHLEMPKPMMAILNALDILEKKKALYVRHKRIPVFLLPELQDRSFDYRIRENADGSVDMLIFKS